MVADGLGAEDQALGDLAIGETLGDHAQNLALAVRQLRKGLTRAPALRAREVVGQTLGDSRAKNRLPAGDPANRTDDRVSKHRH